MHDIFKQIYLTGIVPVIKITDVSKAVPLARALSAGGLNCAEVTFRTAQAADAIRAISGAMPEMLVGAGTVLTRAQAADAVHAGAKFIVSPGLNPEVVKFAQSINLPILPGCCTPGEIEQALVLGLEVVKFFPAEAAGGLEMVKALAAPYGDVSFVPTGGIGPVNLLSYLSFKKVLACGGSWMVKEDLIESGQFDRITQITREAVDLMLGFEPVAIDRGDSEDFARLFGCGALGCAAEGFVANAAAPAVVMKTKFPERAAYYLKQRGAVVEDSAVWGKTIQLKDKIGGFTVYVI